TDELGDLDREVDDLAVGVGRAQPLPEGRVVVLPALAEALGELDCEPLALAVARVLAPARDVRVEGGVEALGLALGVARVQAGRPAVRERDPHARRLELAQREAASRVDRLREGAEPLAERREGEPGGELVARGQVDARHVCLLVRRRRPTSRFYPTQRLERLPARPAAVLEGVHRLDHVAGEGARPLRAGLELDRAGHAPRAGGWPRAPRPR